MSQIDISILSAEEKAALLCFYYAHLNSQDAKYKDCYNNLRLFAEKYNFKYGTLKNDKDAYDACFDNGRSGWHDKPLEKRKRILFEIMTRYSETSVEELGEAVSAIITEAKTEGKPFFSIKTKDAKTVDAVLKRSANVEFDGINILQDSLKVGQPVFIVFGGDRPSWTPGLAGMGIISKEPYDIGYEGRNFKIQVDIKLLLDKHISREDLLPYKDTYGIIGIGPITKWEPNQAISQLSEKKAVALMRAMLELNPNIENDFNNIIDPEMMGRIKGAATKFVEVEVNFNEQITEGIREKLELEQDIEPDAASSDDAEDYTKDDFLNEVFISEDEYETLCALLERKKNIILQGAPGVGKTFAAKRLAYSILQKKDSSKIKIVQFHQSYSYEDFVAGFRPTSNGFELENGPFYEFCMKAKKSSAPHFVIIDEINRGNLSKIFGELLMLIEADKRNESINLLYKNEEFSVPENVYIIGMMNTADRSLAMIDYALRRRFAFYEMLPAFSSAKFKEKIAGSCDKTEKLIEAVEELNRIITDDDALGSGFQIGHSYFCMDKPLTEADLNMIVEYELVPLINEYWFDEPDKIKTYCSKLRGVLK